MSRGSGFDFKQFMNTEQFQIFMFHFRCPVCGSSPKRVLLRDYLRGWSNAPSERLHRLLSVFSGALKEIRHGNACWHTKAFRQATDSLKRTVEKLHFDPPITPQSSLRSAASASLHFAAHCPVCE